MSLLDIEEEDLIKIAKMYSGLISKYHKITPLRAIFSNKMGYYTKEMKARGVNWRKKR